MLLSELAATECTIEIDLRGHKVPVRWVPSSVQRKIEQVIRPTPVTGEDPKQVAKHKASEGYQAQLRKIEFQQQCLRAAYAAGLEVDGIKWADDIDRGDAIKLADAVAAILTDAELSVIYQASYACLVRQNDPKDAIGTEDAEGN